MNQVEKHDRQVGNIEHTMLDGNRQLIKKTAWSTPDGTRLEIRSHGLLPTAQQSAAVIASSVSLDAILENFRPRLSLSHTRETAIGHLPMADIR